MLREINVQTLTWADKTMSVLRTLQLEACEARVDALPAFGLFSGCDDSNVEQLWRLSYDAQEHPMMRRLHTASELITQVMIQLPAEAALLSPQEDMLLDRLLSLGGTAPLLDWDELDAAESLVRRLWCTLRKQDDHIVLHLPEELRTPLLLVTTSRAHQEIRTSMDTFHSNVQAILYLSGMLSADTAISLLQDAVLKGTYANDLALARRFLRTAFDCTYSVQGQMLLLHPGLADPDHLEKQQPLTPQAVLKMSDHVLRQASEGMLDEERPMYTMMYGLLSQAVRPEIGVEEAVEDLRMLAKQGVSPQEMNEVLSSLLIVQPTDAMRSAALLLLQTTPKWGTKCSGMVQ